VRTAEETKEGMMTIETIQIGNAEGHDITVTMRGKAEDIMKVLVNGLTREALEQIQVAIIHEIKMRRDQTP
jgi:RNA:NAD 2'-phosphotransferase (TPT1/KptA family)